jgi:hypothetical protein
MTALLASQSFSFKLDELELMANDLLKTARKGEAVDVEDLRSVTQGLDGTLLLMMDMIKEVRRTSMSAAALGQQIENLEEDVQALLKAVRDGNGHPSLLTRMHDVEAVLEGVRVRDGETKIKHAETVKGRWQAIVALIGALAGGLGLLAKYLLG